ncbi:2',3'-cyclic-nucleotide 3'-phosphodiesterase-like [Centruroides vittatus]|uniref:2',3'-cyclic-nucleotide 3'-phosphodiesterase-like n=1 Tax=Centruroides vittatus TaxID=120091 RepID=UPI00350E964A
MAWSRRKENDEKVKISGNSRPKYVPIDNILPEKIFDFVYLTDKDTIEYLNNHGRIAFVIRGLPGTLKGSLRDLLFDAFKGSVACSAHDYFSLPFAPERDKNTLEKSHYWCKERLEEYCCQNKPVVIVKNSHIRRWEMELYLKVLKRNCYTILMSETTRKFQVNTEILEKSNAKGLKRSYFEKRLRQWEDVVPWFTGWFLSPADGKWIFKKAQEILLTFSESKDFKEIYLNPENVVEKFSSEAVIFCIAAYCNAGRTIEGESFYLNEDIQDVYGKMFELNITAFVLHKNTLTAAVRLTSKELEMSYYGSGRDGISRSEERSVPLEEAIDNLSLINTYSRDQPVDATNSKETFEILDEPGEHETEDYGFMLLGWEDQDRGHPLFTEFKDPRDLRAVMTALSENKAEKSVTVDGMTAHKIENSIVIEANQCFKCKSVFTGLY